MSRIVKTVYQIPTHRENISLRAAVAADLHGSRGTAALQRLKELSPDLILIPGDLSNRYCQPYQTLSPAEQKALQNGLAFLCDAVQIAPTFYSFGNHEMGGIHSGRPWADKTFPPYAPPDPEIRRMIEDTGVTLLDDAYVFFQGIAIGGLTSALTYPDRVPNLAFLDEFSALDVYKILLCHHPEYYPVYLKEREIDLTVSGHAHGGQWSFFGHAVFAPGQGLFPRYVKGVHDGRLVISRGMTNNAYVPRICVPREVLLLEIGNMG